MKTKRKLCAAVSNLIFCISIPLIRLPMQASAADYTNENLTYTEKYPGIAITGCSEDVEALVIPEEIDGKTVTAIESRAFVNHTKLKSVELPDSLRDLGDRVFTGCTALESVNLPEGLTGIKHNTFNGCSSLESIVIPDSVRTIGTGAFRNCTHLAEITFPKQLDMINSTAFTDTVWLENQPEGYVCVSNVLCWYKGTMPENTELTLDPSITVIADGALSEQSNLTAVTFHDRIKAIGWGAFHETGIARADIPPVNQLGTDTFSNCENLKSVTIPGTVKSIGTNAFAGCTSLETVTLQNGIQTVGMNAFLDCRALNSITIPLSVKQIGGAAFGYRTPDNPGGDDILMLKASDDFTVYGYPYTAAETYAEKNGFLFAEPADAPAGVPGDVNCDGSFSISDVVLFQKWLLTAADTPLKKPENADLNADGRLDASDLSMMKQVFMRQAAQELKIRITWDSNFKQKDEVCRFLQDSIERQIPDFDFSQFSFEWRENQYNEPTSNSHLPSAICFRLYYQDIPLDYDRYPVIVTPGDYGRYVLNADFLTSAFLEKLTAIDITGVISKQEAIDTAKAYASEMPLPTETGKYVPSASFGEETVLMYYAVEENCLAYKVHDSYGNRYSLGGGFTTLYDVKANVFVNARTGDVLENRYDQLISIS
ncbi:MAG: leucine-rich repeat protein [Oscillospiraceae bacterium]|nr:leucine-rich repeat protein [Oscillospiraceae bacterium]